MRHEKTKILPSRMVNVVALNLMRGHGLTYTDFALKLGDGFTTEQVKYHFEYDSDNSFMIARMAEILGLPTQPSNLFADGGINKEMKRQMAARGLTYKDVARKLLPKDYSADQGWMIDKVQNFFYTNSTDGWMVARLCEIFGLRTIPSYWFLNLTDAEKLKKKRQLELSL